MNISILSGATGQDALFEWLMRIVFNRNEIVHFKKFSLMTIRAKAEVIWLTVNIGITAKLLSTWSAKLELADTNYIFL